VYGFSPLDGLREPCTATHRGEKPYTEGKRFTQRRKGAQPRTEEEEKSKKTEEEEKSGKQRKRKTLRKPIFNQVQPLAR